MDRPLQLRLLSELVEMAERGQPAVGLSDARVPVATYRAAEWQRAEQEALFRRLPVVVGHTSEIPNPGDYLTHDASGVPLLVVRRPDGVVRAFLNVCRHRGTKLVSEPRGNARAFVCRYHAWSYELNGSLLRVPHRECFPSLRDEEAGLVAVPLAERCGFLFAVPGGRGAELDIDPYLGSIATELDWFGMGTHHVHRHVVDHRKANWKLVIDAFLEGYHVRSLHRETISRFFVDGVHMEAFPPHSRSLGARKGIDKARSMPQESWDIREFTTPFYLLFPNTILVIHPDWVTVLTLFPDGPDRLHYSHRMLIPKPPQSEAESKHWDKTFQLIEGNVFQREDLSIAESIQAGMSAEADTHFRLGQMEAGIAWFHQQIAQHVAQSGLLTPEQLARYA